MTRTFKLTVAYDGTDFFGWQSQSARRTVQQTLQLALAKVTGAPVVAVASGRTDAGVHALGQVVGFSTDCLLPEDVLARALNAELPRDLAVLDIEQVASGFDPIRQAKRKRYRYIIQDGRTANIFARRYVWHVYRRLDADAMRRSAMALVGRHDFASFETSGSNRITSIRTIHELTVERLSPGGIERSRGDEARSDDVGEIRVEIEADGFLYHMARNIVGALAQVGRKAHDERWPAEVLAGLDRKAAGCAAPPQGLYLVSVRYAPDES